jgi:hypothetical protein
VLYLTFDGQTPASSNAGLLVKLILAWIRVNAIDGDHVNMATGNFIYDTQIWR